MNSIRLIILSLLSVGFLSCNSLYYKRNLYVPVKSTELKYNSNYKSIKELDSVYNSKTGPFQAMQRDSVLSRNQKIVDQINNINVKLDSNLSLKNENKLYTLQEVGYGKYVKTYYKRDLRNNYVAYTKRKLSAVELILYAIGLYFLIYVITVIIAAIVVVAILIALTGSV
jgi:hypothetical protein